MFVILMVLAALGSTLAGYADSSSPNDVNNAFGYSGSFSGSTNEGIPAGFPNPGDFESLLNGYFDSFRKYHEQFIKTQGLQFPAVYSSASSSPNAKAQASSSITYEPGFGLQQQAQAAGHNPGYATGFSSSGGTPNIMNRFGGGGHGAVASASLGPGGGYQTAAVYPQNPNSPNIVSRFAEGGGGGGSYFTSSVSSSSNLDGKPQNFAQTTINDNGKVTTYTVKNP